VELRTCKNCGVEKELSPEFFRECGKGYLSHKCRKCNAQAKRLRRGKVPTPIPNTRRVCKVCKNTKVLNIKFFHHKEGYFTHTCKTCYNRKKKGKLAPYVAEKQTRVCKKCGEEKPLNTKMFEVHRHIIGYTCRVCGNAKRREYYKANKERIYKHTRKWIVKNKERVRELNRRWYLQHKEHVDSKRTAIYHEYPDHIIKAILASHSSLSLADIPQELVDVKRLQLQILRACK
jgi:hypothetical protein